jgi:GntR family transcriptional regulator
MAVSRSRDVRAQIHALADERGLVAGDKLPPERELAAQLQLSRTTLRRALEGMERSGLITRRVGRGGGTFLSDPAGQPSVAKIDRTTAESVPELLARQGFRARTRVLSAALLEADETMRTRLDVEAGGLVIELRRLRFADDVPISIETMHLPEDLFPGLIEGRLNGSLRELLQDEYGVVPARIAETVEIVPSSREDSAVLQIEVGDPLLRVTRVSYDSDGRRLEYSVDHFRADRTRLSIESYPGSAPTQLRVLPPKPRHL